MNYTGRNLKLVNDLDTAINNSAELRCINKQSIDGIILEEDFIPYIVPTVYIGRSYGNKLSFKEGNESFLSVV